MSPPSVCSPLSGDERDAVGEDRIQEGVTVEEEGGEDGEDEGEDEEGEEEENEPDLEVEPDEEGPTDQRNQQHPQENDEQEESEEEEPMPTMKRPAGAGTTGKRGKVTSTKSTAIPKAGKGTKAKGKGKAGAKTVVPKATPKKKGNGKGNGKNAGKTTTPPKKSRPEDLVNSDEWMASTEKRLKGELEEAPSYY